jgi:hypothetical protein
MTVNQMKGACSGAQLSSFMASCFSTTATTTACQTFQSDSANLGCVDCLFGVTDAGTASNTGGVLLDYTLSYFFESNQPGCIAIEDPTNGPACAQALEPLDQCDYDACGSNAACNTTALYDACVQTANAAGGACATYLNAAQTPCVAYFGLDAGLGSTGVCSTNQDVISVICGNGSGDGG